MTEMENVYKEIKKARRLAIKHHIGANTIMIDKTHAKTPWLNSVIVNNDSLPPMILGMELKICADELPDEFVYALTEAQETEREKLARESAERARNETLREVYEFLADQNKASGGLQRHTLLDFFAKFNYVEAEE